MKKKIATLVIALCLATTSTAFAQRPHYSNHGGYSHGYQKTSHQQKQHRGGHRNDGIGITVGIIGGLLLGTALMDLTPSPQAVAIGEPYYIPSQPKVIVRQPRICVEERIVNGQWQTSRYDGRRVWVSFANPVHQRIEVPCH